MAHWAMTTAELQSRIESATKEIAQNYQKGLKKVGELKTNINDLELIITDNAYTKTSRDMDKLGSAVDELIKLTDLMISESERAWEQYRKLEHDCEADECDASKLNALRDLCKKTDEFATDLLCYSLAHFKRKDI
jgi:hypothetical protein